MNAKVSRAKGISSPTKLRSQLPLRKPSSFGKIETETALIIRDHPLENARRIAGLSSILDYDLKRKPSVTIHDTYFDTNSKYFTSKRISFRVRRSGRQIILSAKSSPHRLAGGGTSRLEIERPWSYDAFLSIARKFGLKPPSRDLLEHPLESPSRVLVAAGLQIIQNRVTRRKSREIVSFRGGKPFVFAELSIDDVTYNFSEGQVRLLEVEIESKSAGALPKIRGVVNCLLSEYPALRIWAHGKFVTGLAIKKLLKDRSLDGLTREKLVNARAFGLIDRTVRAGAALTT